VHLLSQATQEAEIRRITVPGQPCGKKFVRSHLNSKKLDMVAGFCHPSDGRKHQIGGSWFGLAWAKSESLSPK
jgi:hypothetical protein